MMLGLIQNLYIGAKILLALHARSQRKPINLTGFIGMQVRK